MSDNDDKQLVPVWLHQYPRPYRPTVGEYMAANFPGMLIGRTLRIVGKEQEYGLLRITGVVDGKIVVEEVEE
jgi:hypothetical protein